MSFQHRNSFQVMFFWVVVLPGDVAGYQQYHAVSIFRMRLHHSTQKCWYPTISLDSTTNTLKIVVACTSKMMAYYHITTWCHNPEDHDLNLQCLCKSQILHRNCFHHSIITFCQFSIKEYTTFQLCQNKHKKYMKAKINTVKLLLTAEYYDPR
jgi:hypothetical protein